MQYEYHSACAEDEWLVIYIHILEQKDQADANLKKS